MSEHLPDRSCGHAEEALSDLINDELELAEKRRVAVHTAACPHCAQTLGGLFAARAALSVPDPGKVTMPRAFWLSVRSRLDQVDSLVRATDVGRARRPFLARPAVAVALGLIAVAMVGKAMLTPRQDVLGQMVRMHTAGTVRSGTPGRHQTVGHGLVTRWQPVSRDLLNVHGMMVLQTTYDVDGLPVSVFRLPEGQLDVGQLVSAPVGREVMYMGVLDSSSLAAIPSGDAWEVVIARTLPDDLISLAMSRPREVRLGPDL